MTDTYTRQVLEGLAGMLKTAGAGSYNGPTTPPDEGARAIVFSFMPASPTQAISLTRYLDVPGILAINQVRVQVHSRVGTDPLEGEDLVDLIRDTLHRKTHVTLGTLRFNLIEQESFAALGPDGNGRFEYTQNFTLTGNRYSA